MIFTKIQNEGTVQADDKTRITVDSFISGGSATITLIEIDPDTSGNYYDITANSYFDWAFSTPGVVTTSVRVTDSDVNIDIQTTPITIISVTDDNLFSSDSNLIPYEPEMMNWVQSGRNTFIDKHRTAQTEILNELDANRIWKDDNTRYVAADIVDIQEFKEWSKFITLRIIFEGLSNDLDDVFSVKAKRYSSLTATAKKRASLRLDSDADGIISASEKTDILSGAMRRR